MSNGAKIADILRVFHMHGNYVECHAEHDILLFCEVMDDVDYAQELEAAGAFFSSEHSCWAIYCSA